jgi:hypothetical protein
VVKGGAQKAERLESAKQPVKKNPINIFKFPVIGQEKKPQPTNTNNNNQ